MMSSDCALAVFDEKKGDSCFRDSQKVARFNEAILMSDKDPFLREYCSSLQLIHQLGGIP